jgi:hypothetical protein
MKSKYYRSEFENERKIMKTDQILKLSGFLKKAVLCSVLSLIPLLLLSSCAATLSGPGSRVQTVTDRQRECCCEFIEIVTASQEWGVRTGSEAESAIYAARNRVAELGGNAMRILDIDSGHWGTTVVAEALKCDFNRMNALKNR